MCRFQASASHYHLPRYVDHVSVCINEALEDMVAWPSSEERKQLHNRMSVCSGAVAVLDGTHCSIHAPVRLGNLHYSGYKCDHTQNYLVCVNSSRFGNFN